MIGEPHAVRGEVPVACVVRREGAAVTGEDLLAFAANGLASYKRLARAIFEDAIPRGPSGKILRRAPKENLPDKGPGTGAGRATDLGGKSGPGEGRGGWRHSRASITWRSRKS